jgi:uncharacterized membrane protein
VTVVRLPASDVARWTAVSFVFILGTFLRFHALDRQSLWDDEIATLRTITTPLPQLVHRLATEDAHPPLYYLQLKLWRHLHFRSLVKLRANSALWGSLSLFLAYLMGRLYGGEALGFLTLALLALSPYHLAYSQEIRPYAMEMALALAAWLNLERTRRFGQAQGLPLQIFLWMALLYTHYWGAFIVLAQVIYGLMASRSNHERKALLAAAVISGVLFTPWLPVLSAQVGVVNRVAFWVSAFSVDNLAKVFLAYSGLVFNMASSVFYLPARVWMMAAIGLAFAAALMMGLRRGPRSAILWLSVGLIVPWLLSIWNADIFVWYRYPVIMLPAFALWVASGVLGPTSDVQRRTWDVACRTILMAVLLSSQAWGAWIYFHSWQKANPKSVVAYVHRIRQPGSVVVRPDYFADLFNFYDQGTTLAVDEHLLDSPDRRTALRGKNLIFIAFDVPSDPVGDALLTEFKPVSARYFPGTAHLGITVYELNQVK